MGTVALLLGMAVSEGATFRQDSELQAQNVRLRDVGRIRKRLVCPLSYCTGGAKEFRPGRSFGKKEILQCVPIWYLGHSLMCPIVISCVNWRARRHGSSTSRIPGFRTQPTKFFAVFILRIRDRLLPKGHRHPNRWKGAGPHNGAFSDFRVLSQAAV